MIADINIFKSEINLLTWVLDKSFLHLALDVQAYTWILIKPEYHHFSMWIWASKLAQILIKIEYHLGRLVENMVIWINVFKKYNILDLQIIIADKINLNLGSSSTVQTRKVLLSLFLKGMEFLLILHDLRSPLDLG